MNVPNSKKRQSLGRWGESVAAEYLLNHGYQILDRNFRTRYGELDLIARKDDQLIFIEVKTRGSRSLGNPEISVTPKKQSHLLASAQAYLQDHPECLEPWRVDVIAIVKGSREADPELVHFENAIS